MAGRGRRIIYSKKMYSFEMEEKKKKREREKKIAGKKWRMQKGRKITEVGASVEGKERERRGANSV